MFLSSSTTSSFGMRMRSGERKVDCEDISAQRTLGEYSAAVRFDDFFCDLQSQCFCAAFRILGHPSNTAVENGVGYFRRHGGARVRDPKPKAARIPQGMDVDFASVGVHHSALLIRVASTHDSLTG